MAGSVCKFILNNGVAGLSQSIERALTTTHTRGVLMDFGFTEQDMADMIQALADFDVRTYTGVDPMRRSGCAAKCNGLKDVLMVLGEKGAITDEVFEVFG